MTQFQLENTVRVLMLALIIMSTALLAVGAHSFVLLLLTLIVAPIAVYATDVKRWVYLNQTQAGVVALAAVGLTAYAVLRSDRNGQMLAVATLQSYLQYVLLFQPKTARTYWQLALMALGQIAIAATLVPSVLFGVTLLTFFLVGILAFALLLVCDESSRFAAPEVQTVVPEVASALTPAETPTLRGASAPLAWRGGWGLMRQGAFISLFIISVTAPIYAFLPRWNVTEQLIATDEPQRTVGFSKTVTLGDLGEAVDNPDLVMRVQFFRGGFGTRSIKLDHEPLFRGTVLDRYDGRTWTQVAHSAPVRMPREEVASFVRQKTIVEPLEVNELFAVFPVFALHDDRRIRIDGGGNHLFRSEELRSRQIEFEIGTTGIVGNHQQTIISAREALDPNETEDLLQMPSDRTRDRFEGLRQLAAKVLRDAEIELEDRMTGARALSNYFRDSGKFYYTVDPPPRDKNLDPLEDFVSKNPYGHCEYFAGALVMMLRSQGIPARMAIGFKGGEWNAVGDYYQVQQLHAHAWVEVYLMADELPEEEFGDDPTRGAWLTLDPTEGIQEGNRDTSSQGLLASLRQYVDFSLMMWNNYVVGLNASRQRQTVYEPFVQGVRAGVANIIGPEVWRARVRKLNHSPIGAFWAWYRRHWFSWRGGLVAIVFSSLVAAALAGSKVLVVLLRRWGFLPEPARNLEPPVVEFYRRLEAVLSKFGYRRAATQTAYEFAQAAGGDLAESLQHQGLAHLPRRVVDSFYRVRFGRRTLDKQEVDAVEHALTELETALARPR